MGKKKILIIDDDQGFVRPTQVTLEARGFEVYTAANGAQGRETAKRVKPSVIILDVMMPGEHGLAALEKLKADEEIAQIPVIVSTNLEKALPIVRGHCAGFVLKSETSMDQLAKKVSEVVGVDANQEPTF